MKAVHEHDGFESRLLRFIRDDLLDARPVAVTVDTYLFDHGMIDSLKILRLIAFIETQIGRKIGDREVVMEHFRTVRAMTDRFGGGR